MNIWIHDVMNNEYLVKNTCQQNWFFGLKKKKPGAMNINIWLKTGVGNNKYLDKYGYGKQ